MATQHHETREVRVSNVKGNGFQDTAGDWINVSKFADPADCPIPVVGATVRVSLDSKGFARRVEVLENATNGPQRPIEAPRESGITVNASQALTVSARDVQITRMNALSHAVQIVSANRVGLGDRVALDDVLACAAKIEAWITR